MKTQLPTLISTREEAEEFLKALSDNREEYHPEDDAHEIVFTNCSVSFEEREQLNKLMQQVYDTGIDPCEYLLNLK